MHQKLRCNIVEPLSCKILLMRKFQTQIIITTKVFRSTVDLLLTSITMATCQYSQNWWVALTSFSLRLLQNRSQMPIKWILETCTSRRSINQLENCMNITLKNMNRLHNLGSQIVIFKYSWTHCTPQVDLQYHFYPMSPWMFIDKCRQTQNLLNGVICEAPLPIHCRQKQATNWLLITRMVETKAAPHLS